MGPFDREQNVLYIANSVEDTATHFNRPVEDIMKLIEVSKAKLRDYRDRERPRPHLDDKILTCWNGLMVSCVHCDSNFLI